MEPQITARDVALLLMSEDSLLTLVAVLGWQARTARDGRPFEDPAVVELLPA